MFFRGRWDYQLDDRNRLALPPVYRTEFAARAVLVQGVEPCVAVYTEDGWREQANFLTRLGLQSDQARDAERAFFSSSHEVVPDGQGRFVIPAFLLESAGLHKDVRVVGVRGCLEVWDRATWDAREAQLRDTHRAVLNAISALPGLGQGG